MGWKLYIRNRLYKGVFRFIFCLIFVLGFSVLSVSGGELGDLEHDATKENHGSHGSYDDDDDYLDEVFKSCLDSCFDSLFESIFHPRGEPTPRVEQQADQDEAAASPVQTTGAQTSFFRFDSEYQSVKGDVSAYDLRAEGGYGIFGVQVRNTHYREKYPADRLDFFQALGLVMMPIDKHFELDIGAGFSTLSGTEKHSGISGALSFKARINNAIGFELRPCWTSINGNTLSDYDLGMDLGFKNAAVRAGYRWVQSEHASLNGPYVGVSFRF